MAPSHGPAALPCTKRVMIWHPVSVMAVLSPSSPKHTCSCHTSVMNGMYTSRQHSAVSVTVMMRFPGNTCGAHQHTKPQQEHTVDSRALYKGRWLLLAGTHLVELGTRDGSSNGAASTRDKDRAHRRGRSAAILRNLGQRRPQRHEHDAAHAHGQQVARPQPVPPTLLLLLVLLHLFETRRGNSRSESKLPEEVPVGRPQEPACEKAHRSTVLLMLCVPSP